MPAISISPAPFFHVARVAATAHVPTRGSSLAAGYDLYASEPIVIEARGRGVAKTGIKIAIPQDTYARIAPRSGLAVKHGIDTAAGVIDADYRGEIMVALFNNSDKDFCIKPGDRIAQMILERIYTPEIVEISDEELSETERGAKRFGSTGGHEGL